MAKMTNGQDPWKEQQKKMKAAALEAETKYDKGVAGQGKVWRKEMNKAATTGSVGDIKSWGGRDWKLNLDATWKIQPAKEKAGWLRRKLFKK